MSVLRRVYRWFFPKSRRYELLNDRVKRLEEENSRLRRKVSDNGRLARRLEEELFARGAWVSKPEGESFVFNPVTGELEDSGPPFSPLPENGRSFLA